MNSITNEMARPDMALLRQAVDRSRAWQKNQEERLVAANGALDRAMAAYTIEMMRYSEDTNS